MNIYKLFDKKGELLYLGISYSAIARMAQHKAEKHWWPEVTRIEIESLGFMMDRRAAEARERALIRKLRPRYNVTHNGGRHDVETSSGPSRRDGYHVGNLATMDEWHQAMEALDRLGRKLDKMAREGRAVPSREEFLDAVQSASQTLPYGDMCDGCVEVRWPVEVRVESGWAKCGYVCLPCRRRWTCGWTTDLVSLAV